ncbi:hypothetical protein [Ralstonia pseudosolanacearum]
MRQWPLAMMMGVLVCACAGAKDAVVPVPMVGAVELNDGDAWIAVPTGKTVTGPVGVVTLEGTYRCCYVVGPQQARQGNREFGRDGEALSWHALTPLKGAEIGMALGIAVPAQAPVNASAIASGTRFTWRRRVYRLTQCTSSEGVHLMLDGDGRRLRHYYYYLGYDTESDCDERELARPEQPS